MRTESDITAGTTNGAGGTSAVKPPTDGNSAVDDCDWFSDAAWKLYVHKPGTALFHLTDLGDERLCQRYAEGSVRPNSYFLRRLLRSKHGEQWLNATMDGCTEPWWIELQRARKVAAAIRDAQAT